MPVQLKMNVIKNYKVLEKPAYPKKLKERKVGPKKNIGVLASMRKLLKMCSIPTQAPTQAPTQNQLKSEEEEENIVDDILTEDVNGREVPDALKSCF